jgi:hypothetical protein
MLSGCFELDVYRRLQTKPAFSLPNWEHDAKVTAPDASSGILIGSLRASALDQYVLARVNNAKDLLPALRLPLQNAGRRCGG